MTYNIKNTLINFSKIAFFLLITYQPLISMIDFSCLADILDSLVQNIGNQKHNSLGVEPLLLRI